MLAMVVEHGRREEGGDAVGEVEAYQTSGGEDEGGVRTCGAVEFVETRDDVAALCERQWRTISKDADC